jgi:hypothetical protein
MAYNDVDASFLGLPIPFTDNRAVCEAMLGDVYMYEAPSTVHHDSNPHATASHPYVQMAFFQLFKSPSSWRITKAMKTKDFLPILVVFNGPITSTRETFSQKIRLFHSK